MKPAFRILQWNDDFSNAEIICVYYTNLMAQKRMAKIWEQCKNASSYFYFTLDIIYVENDNEIEAMNNSRSPKALALLSGDFEEFVRIEFEEYKRRMRK